MNEKMTAAEEKAAMKAEAAAARGAGAADEAAKPKSGSGKKKTMTSYQVEITKDPMMKPVLRVFEHEIMILEQLHGPDNVEVREDSARQDEFDATAEEEYSRLETRFGRSGQEALRRVYGSPASLAEATGLTMGPGRRRLGARNAATETIQSRQRGSGDN